MAAKRGLYGCSDKRGLGIRFLCCLHKLQDIMGSIDFQIYRHLVKNGSSMNSDKKGQTEKSIDDFIVVLTDWWVFCSPK